MRMRATVIALFSSGTIPISFAQTTNENVVERLPNLPSIEGERLSMEADIRFFQEIERNEDAVMDRLGHPSILMWARRTAHGGYQLQDMMDRAGRGAVVNLLGDSARETALSFLPLEEWTDFGAFLLDSFGNTVEERTATVSASYTATQYAWWQQLREEETIRYGIRPWRSDPYAFLGTKIGNWGQNGLAYRQPVMSLEMRVRYSFPLAGRLEAAMDFPLPESFRLSIGMSTRLIGRDSTNFRFSALSARLERALKDSPKPTILYVGAKTSVDEKLWVVAGVDVVL